MANTIYTVSVGDYADTVQLAAFVDRDDAERYRAIRQADRPTETFVVDELALYARGEQPERQNVHVRFCLVLADGSLRESQSRITSDISPLDVTPGMGSRSSRRGA